MKRTARHFLVLVTAPNRRHARTLAQAALESKLCACVNLVGGLESHYWWRGKIDRSTEVLLLIKTTKAALGALEKVILARHPYDTPEFLVIGLFGGNERYLRWMDSP